MGVVGRWEWGREGEDWGEGEKGEKGEKGEEGMGEVCFNETSVGCAEPGPSSTKPLQRPTLLAGCPLVLAVSRPLVLRFVPSSVLLLLLFRPALMDILAASRVRPRHVANSISAVELAPISFFVFQPGLAGPTTTSALGRALKAGT